MEDVIFQIFVWGIIILIIVIFSRKKKPAQTPTSTGQNTTVSQDAKSKLEDIFTGLEEQTNPTGIEGEDVTDTSLDTSFSTLDTSSYEVGSIDSPDSIVDTADISVDVNDVSSTQLGPVNDEVYRVSTEKRVPPVLQDFDLKKALIYSEIITRKHF